MNDAQKFTSWAEEQGVEIDGVAIQEYDGRGFGLIATKDVKENDTILSIPASSLHNIVDISPEITDAIEEWYAGSSPPPKSMSVNGILALSLMQSPTSPWKAMLPSKADLIPSLPHQWPTSLSTLLPPSAQSILTKQRAKINVDFTHAAEIFGRDIIDHDEYIYYWFLVSTRTFYWTAPAAPPPKLKGKKSPAAKRALLKQKREQKEKEEKIDHDDCISLAPFADMFNHTPKGSVSVTFTTDGYTLNALQDITKGQELSISYGNHSNDFLLVEYGFLIPSQENCWDEMALDGLLEGLFDEEKKQVVKDKGYWGKWILDGEGICYRTKVALALLYEGMTRGRWERMVDSGEDGGESVKKAIETIVVRVLVEHRAVIERRLREIEEIKEGTDSQKGMLRERWKQIESFVVRYLESRNMK